MKLAESTIQRVFVFLFCILFIGFKRIAFFAGYDRLLVSAVLGGAGAGFGFLLYKSVSDKSTSLKFMVLAIALIPVLFFLPAFEKKPVKKKVSPQELIVLQLKNMIDSIDSVTKVKIDEIIHRPVDTTFVFAKDITPLQRKNLLTCEICGYRALLKDSASCLLCYGMVFDTTIYKKTDHERWLRDEQLFFFSVDSGISKVDLYYPKTDHGFRKDPLWKPLVTEAEVISYSNK